MKIRGLRKWIVLTIGVAIMITTGGCAFGTRNIALRYEPVTKVTGTPGESIAIVKFTDVREESVLGEVRNGYGWKTAKVVAEDQDVGAWVANALADELSKAGYTIMKYKDAAPPDITISITGKVNTMQKCFGPYEQQLKQTQL